ncbi:flavodoxin domain-containing protein [Luteolibacter pohnpeiensis]|uniref:Flavodoxin domain-containing protein n=1 Tax=Luteolibacter pohnpeiensis TaxID=454153 RepID=A0A934S8L6_9BACT|nr:flavodoxin domain-containing protein [Luteolibacter pohnpeiensis]MBK1883813.1 flavodoxin domain-containing protein [Luteolibacter pohnpeiensis]
MKLTLPENAPFSCSQKMWIKGFLDGINSTIQQQSNPSQPSLTEPSTASGKSITIAFGSQTGTAESLSKKLSKKLNSKGCISSIRDLASMTPDDLKNIEHLLLITSTYGDGEPPDNAATFHRLLHEETAPPLNTLAYSVLALGDSSYAEFCKCGRDFDQRLAALGAKRITPIVECDVDYDDPFESWTSQIELGLSAA